MFVGSGGEMVGSMSDGCVEGSLYYTGMTVIESGLASRHRFGVGDDHSLGVD